MLLFSDVACSLFTILSKCGYKSIHWIVCVHVAHSWKCQLLKDCDWLRVVYAAVLVSQRQPMRKAPVWKHGVMLVLSESPGTALAPQEQLKANRWDFFSPAHQPRPQGWREKKGIVRESGLEKEEDRKLSEAWAAITDCSVMEEMSSTWRERGRRRYVSVDGVWRPAPGFLHAPCTSC